MTTKNPMDRTGSHEMNEQVLVTGGSGFIGAHVVRHLLAEGRTVTALGRHPVPGATLIHGDLTQPVQLGNEGYDTVIHLAGLAHVVPKTEAQRAAFDEVNLGGTRNLLAALKRKPRAFVLISTVAVYGAETGLDLSEETACQATDPYGISRKAAEDVAQEWCATNDVRLGVARLPLVIGRNAPGNFGAMVRAMTRGRYFGVGKGSARRSMVLADDVAAILPRLADTGGVYHLTDRHDPTFAELETAIARALHRTPPHRLPMWLARAGAAVGDLFQGLTGRALPLNGRSLGKMTNSLTFSSRRADAIGWSPSRVVDHIGEHV